MRNKLGLTACIMASTFMAAACCRAGVVITVAESGSDVTATLSGSITTWAGATLTLAGNAVGRANLVRPGPLGSGQSIVFAATNPSLGSTVSSNYYTVPVRPTNFGTLSGPFQATASTASTLLFAWGARTADNVYIAQSYTLGTPITGVLTWQNNTIAGLGMTPGSYLWSWGTPSTPGAGDTITLNVVPEPSVSCIALVGLACGGYSLSRRRKPNAA